MKPFRPEFGVFETMRNYGREVFKLDEHLRRLERSAEIVGMSLPKSLDEIREMVLALTFDGPKRIRVVATPDDVVIETYPIASESPGGKSAICLEVERERPEAKAFPYDVSLDAHDEAERQGHYEALLVDRDGNVREGAYSNVFWVKDGQVFTTDRDILRGVTREVVMDLVDVEFGEITPDELKKVDEIFITKTTTGVSGITEIDGVKVGEVGPVTKKLNLHFANLEEVSD